MEKILSGMDECFRDGIFSVFFHHVIFLLKKFTIGKLKIK